MPAREGRGLPPPLRAARERLEEHVKLNQPWPW
jgi:hypothetical protein